MKIFFDVFTFKLVTFCRSFKGEGRGLDFLSLFKMSGNFWKEAHILFCAAYTT